MHRQISNWRKDLSITAETGTGSDNGNLQQEKEENFSKIYSDKCQRICTVDREIEAEGATESPKNQKIRKKGKISISRIRCSKKTPTNFTETWA